MIFSGVTIEIVPSIGSTVSCVIGFLSIFEECSNESDDRPNNVTPLSYLIIGNLLATCNKMMRIMPDLLLLFEYRIGRRLPYNREIVLESWLFLSLLTGIPKNLQSNKIDIGLGEKNAIDSASA